MVYDKGREISRGKTVYIPGEGFWPVHLEQSCNSAYENHLGSILEILIRGSPV